jgi:hypothetical protein
MLVMQNSPHLHSESLYGQYIRPQACPFPFLGWTSQPFASAYASAISISFLGCGRFINRLSLNMQNKVVK